MDLKEIARAPVRPRGTQRIRQEMREERSQLNREVWDLDAQIAVLRMRLNEKVERIAEITRYLGEN